MPKKISKTEKSPFPEFRIPLPINLQKFLRTRAIIHANSGGGKSWLVRKLNETFFGHVQQIILDPEGEYSSLREKFGYVLVGKGGDIPLSVRHAGAIASRFLKLGLSGIIDMSEFDREDQIKIVSEFLRGLIGAPEEFWHSSLIYLDEAQIFCPEDRSALSAKAVKELMTLGRKRGLCGVLACQRISELSKSAAAECNNKFIGRTTLDNDQIRSGRELGYSKKQDIIALRRLNEGEFLCFGPAISQDTQKFIVGPVKTTHYESGSGIRTSPPTPAAIKGILKSLADIPQEAEKELRSKKDMQDEIVRLQAALKKAEKEGGGTKAEDHTRKLSEYQQIIKEKDGAIKGLTAKIAAGIKTIQGYQDKVKRAFFDPLKALNDSMAQYSAEALAKAAEALQVPGDAVAAAASSGIGSDHIRPTARRSAPTPTPVTRERIPKREGTPGGTDIKLPVGEAKILAACAQFPNGLRRDQLTTIVGYKRSSRDAYIQRAKEKGLLEVSGDRIIPTDKGIDALGSDFEPLPTGEDLQEYWLANLPVGEKKILEILIESYPNPVGRDTLSEKTSYQRSSRDAYIQRMTSKEIVVADGRGTVKASDTLFL